MPVLDAVESFVGVICRIIMNALKLYVLETTPALSYLPCFVAR